MSKKNKNAEPGGEFNESVEPVESEPVDQEAAEGELVEKAEPREDWKDKYLRALADLDNVRKRADRDRIQASKFALEGMLRNILPVLDSLHYALLAEGDADVIREGVEIAIKDAHRILGEKGFLPIESLHKQFDPRWHEAVGMRPSDEHPAGTVIEVERAGYMLHDRVLRPSLVHISVQPPSAQQEQDHNDAEAAKSGDTDADV